MTAFNLFSLKGLRPFFLVIAFGVIVSAFHLRFAAGKSMETLRPKPFFYAIIFCRWFSIRSIAR
jgi:hypothetical protein